MGTVRPRRTRFRFAPRIGLVAELRRRRDEVIEFPHGPITRLQSSELDREGVCVDAVGSPPREAGFDQHGPAPAKRVEDGRPRVTHALHEPPRRQRVHSRGIAVKSMDMRARLALVGPHRERLCERIGTRRVAPEPHSPSDVRQRLALPSLALVVHARTLQGNACAD